MWVKHMRTDFVNVLLTGALTVFCGVRRRNFMSVTNHCTTMLTSCLFIILFLKIPQINRSDVILLRRYCNWVFLILPFLLSNVRLKQTIYVVMKGTIYHWNYLWRQFWGVINFLSSYTHRRTERFSFDLEIELPSSFASFSQAFTFSRPFPSCL